MDHFPFPINQWQRHCFLKHKRSLGVQEILHKCLQVRAHMWVLILGILPAWECNSERHTPCNMGGGPIPLHKVNKTKTFSGARMSSWRGFQAPCRGRLWGRREAKPNLTYSEEACEESVGNHGDRQRNEVCTEWSREHTDSHDKKRNPKKQVLVQLLDDFPRKETSSHQTRGPETSERYR